MKNPDPKKMREHLKAGFQLFPCHKPGKNGRDEKGNTVNLEKRPIVKAWQKYEKPSRAVAQKFASTNNIAARLNEKWLVVDCDPRNQGEEGLARLIVDCELDGFDFDPANYYRVATPSGGSHIYMRLPEGVKIGKKHRKYPGVDFLSQGCYVLIPGDVAGGKFYRKVEGSPDLADTPEADETLLRLIQKQEPKAERREEAGQWTCEQLARVLEGIDAMQHGKGEYESFLKILAASHYVSGGAGVEEAILWAGSDIDYADTADSEVRAKWASFSLDKGSAVGAGTLWHYIEESGNDPRDYFPQDTDDLDFDGEPQSYTDEDDLPEEFTYLKDAKGKRTRKVAPTRPNLRLALNKLGVSLRYDLFSRRGVIDGMRGYGPFLGDHEADELRFRIENKYRLKGAEKTFFKIGMTTIARRNSFHPVKNYLESTSWDGTPRLDRWLSTYGGAADTPFNRAVGAIVLIAAVRRIRQPGCKFDELLTLESEEGKNKSSALRILAVRGDWFTDSVPLDADDKHMIEATDGKWIAEIPELQSKRKNDWDSIKSNLSRSTDRARMAYGHFADDRPRQFVCIGTTNSEEYLFSPYGNRRFWPVKIGRFDLAALERDRDQIWAEAAARDVGGASIRLPEKLWQAAAEEQDKRQVEDPFLESLRAKLDGCEGTITTEDIWRLLGVPVERRNMGNAGARMAATMRKLGWEKPNKRGQRRIEGRQTSCYVKGSDVEMQYQMLSVALHGREYIVASEILSEEDEVL